MNGRFFRLAHLQFHPFVRTGDKVKAGKIDLLSGAENRPVGVVGSTGVSTGSHCHIDGTHTAPKSWHQYKNRPFEEYFDTAPWIHKVLPYENRRLTNVHSIAHRGVDGNVLPEDLGLPVYSPVNGTVVYVEPAVSFYRLMRGIRVLFQPTWGQGFGNFLWIEEDKISRAETEMRLEVEKHKAIKQMVLNEIVVATDAIHYLGYTITDVLNHYTNIKRTGKPIFDLTKSRK